MDRPPPVRFPVKRSASLAWMLVGVWVLALMPVLLGLALYAPARSHRLALGVALLASLVGVWRTWCFWRARMLVEVPRAMLGTLIWNGAEWLLEKDGVTAAIAQPDIRCDGQHWLLLRARTNARANRRTLWLWVGRAADPARWHGLRCALYAPASYWDARA